ncbi:MAG TPA: TIGR03067 domain-containing protein [Candidatus Acidoferrales bacterium]|nr:TIGR03067 domain-containing protein [Candidatus Acidoferrales bacterium]
MSRDLDHLQGAWQISALEMDGQRVSAEMLAGARIEISGDRFSSIGMGAEYSGTIRLDSVARPRQIDMKFDSGPETGNVNLGIYELQKNGWRLCIATRGGIRPKKFATELGSGFALETLTHASLEVAARKPKHGNGRHAKAATQHALTKPARPSTATELEGEWQMISGVMNGVAMDKSMTQWVKRVTEGNVSTVTAGPQTMLKVEFSIDARQSPKFIDYVNLAGALKGKKQAGIYSLEKGVLTVCVAAPGSPRPMIFESRPDENHTLTVWKKA